MMKKLFIVLFSVLCSVLFLANPVAAEGEALPLKLSNYEKGLTDKSEKQKITVKGEFTVSCEKPLDSIYLIFYDKTAELTLRAGDREQRFSPKYLRQYIDLTELFGSAQSELVLAFSESAGLTELYGFSGKPPSWVQVWKDPCVQADLCLMTTHADDEQLFFAGVLPYYAGEKGFEVQVIYFTDHVKTPLRRHELLRGLWTVGVEHYPVISSFPDLYSLDGAKAEEQLKAKGFSHEDLVGFQVEMLRRFKPLVVVGHDPKGEYGHGQHIVNSATLQEAVKISANKEAYPESAEKYGVWDVPKTYLHLLEKDPITMNWDIPLERFDGKTAFQMTQEGFLCHESQQSAKFRYPDSQEKCSFSNWLNGEDGSITRSDQITIHSPCNYGLFRSLVGEDTEKNDFFENQLSYGQLREKEEEERLRREEERKKAEKTQKDEQKNTAPTKTEAQQTSLSVTEKSRTDEFQKSEKLFWIVATGGTVVFLLIAFVSGGRRSAKRKRRY